MRSRSGEQEAKTALPGELGWASDQLGQLEAPSQSTMAVGLHRQHSPASMPLPAWPPRLPGCRCWRLAGAQSHLARPGCPVHQFYVQLCQWRPAVSKRGASEPCGTKQGSAQASRGQETRAGSAGHGATDPKPQPGPWVQRVPAPIAAQDLQEGGFESFLLGELRGQWRPPAHPFLSLGQEMGDGWWPSPPWERSTTSLIHPEIRAGLGVSLAHCYYGGRGRPSGPADTCPWLWGTPLPVPLPIRRDALGQFLSSAQSPALRGR